MAPREDAAVQEGGNEAHGEVGDNTIKCLLRLVHRIPDRPVGERCIFNLAPFVLITLQGAGNQIHLGQNIAQPRREFFPPLDATAKHQQ